MKRKKMLLIAFSLTVATSLALYCQKYSFCYLLLAKDAVPVYATASAAMTDSESYGIAELFPQQSVPVLRVVDMKHYFILEVRLPDGQSGFVLKGSYALLKGQRPRNYFPCLTPFLRNCI